MPGARVVTGASCIYEEPSVIWDTGSGAALVEVAMSRDAICALEVSACGAKLVTAGSSIAVWDAATGALLHTVAGKSHSVPGVAVSRGGDTLVAQAHLDGQIDVYGRSGQLRMFIDAHDGPLQGFVLLADGRRLVTFGSSAAVVWDVRRGEEVQLLHGSGGDALQRLAASVDGEVVAACSDTADGAQHAKV